MILNKIIFNFVVIT